MGAIEGYRFVPLPDEVHRQPRPHARHDQHEPGTVKVVLELTYEVARPIHVGSGHWTFRGRTPVRMATQSSGRAVIPGSTIKGVVRSRYEAITKSCCIGRAPRDRKLSRGLPSRTYPEYTVVFDDEVRRHPVFKPCKANSDLCAACALFGLMSLRGRVVFRDLLAPANTSYELAKLPLRFSPRPHHLGKFTSDHSRERLTVTKLRGRKFYSGNLTKFDGGSESAEVLPIGTQLTGTVACTNVTAAEFGGLLTALAFIPASILRVGSAKAYSFGSLKPVRIGTLVGEFPDGFVEHARTAFESSPDYHHVGKHRLSEAES